MSGAAIPASHYARPDQVMPPSHCEHLRKGGADVMVLVMLGIWMLYAVNGFRPPTDPIKLSDENSGGAMRQVIFTGSCAFAMRALLFKGALSQLLNLRMKFFVVGFFMLGSLAWAVMPILTLKRSMIFFFGLTALTTAVHMSRWPVLTMQRMLVYFNGFVAWISILLHFGLPKECTVNPMRPGLAGISNHPNTLAPFLVVGFVLSMGMTVYGRERKLLRTLQVGQLVAAVMTDSVTSLSLMMTSCAIGFILGAKPYFRGTVLNLIAFAVIVVQTVGLTTIRDAALGAAGRDASLSGRDQLWAGVAHEVGKRPLFGHGYGSFWYEGRGREMVVTWNPRQAHNAYLDVMADLGLVGLILVLCVFHGSVLLGYQKYKGGEGTAQRKAMGSLVGCTIGLAVVYAFGQSFIFKLDSFPFLAFLWAVLALSNQDSNNPDAEFAERTEVARRNGYDLNDGGRPLDQPSRAKVWEQAQERWRAQQAAKEAAGHP